MISQEEMLNIVVSEATEFVWPSREREPIKAGELVLRYNLRLIRHEDGRLEWRDD